MGDDKPLILGWPWNYPWHETIAMLQSVTGGKSYQWNLEMMDPTPVVLQSITGNESYQWYLEIMIQL